MTITITFNLLPVKLKSYQIKSKEYKKLKPSKEGFLFDFKYL